jgi:hypothetical protein
VRLAYRSLDAGESQYSAKIMMQFYRGISVPRDAADATIREIRAHGLQPGDGQWTMLAADLKPRLDEIWSKPTITLEDTRPKTPNPSWGCACGEEQGALYYACSHNRTAANDTPILIVFEAHFSEAVVDGRDFLYTVFQLGDPKRSRPIIKRIFGSAILRYADRAWSGVERSASPSATLQSRTMQSCRPMRRTGPSSQADMEPAFAQPFS